MKYERSSMGWNLPVNCTALAAGLKQSGCTRVWIKAGVDNPGLQHVWSQWTDGRLKAFENVGIEVVAWFYIYPESPEVQYETIWQALKARPSSDICLNAEVEWDGYSAAFVFDWVNGLRTYLRNRGWTGRIGFSSVPSWDGGEFGGSPYHDFPYETFVLCTDFDMPQEYWFSPDQSLYENLRNTDNSPVIPILPAWGPAEGGMTDAQLVERARLTIRECRNFAGFSAWEFCHNPYQFDAMGRAYALMPADTEESSDFVIYQWWRNLWTA